MTKREYTALISGANSDIGYELCRCYLETGGRVIGLCHNKRDRLEQLAAKHSNRIDILQADFQDAESVERVIVDNQEILRHVNIFVHLASRRDQVRYGNIKVRDLLGHFQVNVIPAVLLTQFLSEQMVREGWGRIIIGSSIGIKFGGGDDTYCYSLTKLASELLPKAAKEWARHDVLANTVRIGVTDTAGFRRIGPEKVRQREQLIPMQRMAAPDEIANAIFWLASDQNTYITGQVIPVSGGE